MAIYTGDAVRMAYLATYGGSHVNGVAELHSQLLKDVTLKNCPTSTRTSSPT